MARRSSRLLFIPLIGLLGLAAAQAADPPLHFAADRPLDMEHIKLEARVDLEKKQVDAVATLRMTPLRTVESARLNAVDFATRSVKLAVDEAAPAPVRFADDGKHIEVFFPRPMNAGEKLAVVIDYSLEDPKNGLHFFAPGKDEPDAPLLMWSQGESEENRYWVPCFDHPNDRQTSEMVVNVPEKARAISNGRLVSPPKTEQGRTTYHWLQDKPHAAYLLTLIVGEFAMKEATWRGKPVQFYVPEDREADIDRSFARTVDMLELFSNKIGVEYPWDKYAQICCFGFGGGMENTSATTLGESTLHDERAHPDSSSDDLVAHELAHQWWGDLLTCREWAHIWLNEGFASYFEAVWLEHDGGPQEYAYEMFLKEREAVEGGKEAPIVDRRYKDPDELFDSRAYPKGAWVLHMLRCRLGDEVFWKVLNRYATQHAYGLVDTEDLRKAAEDVSGRSLERFFHDWTGRPGHPVLDVSLDWDDDNGLAEVTVKQTPAKGSHARGGKKGDKIDEGDGADDEPFQFPLVLEFVTPASDKPVRIERDVTEQETKILVPLPQRPTNFRVDPQNAVLKEIKESKGSDLWLAQLRDEANLVGRIRAAQHLGKIESDANRRALAEALGREQFWGVQVTLAEQLGELRGDVSRDALIAALKLPNPRARRAVLVALGKFRKDEMAIAAVRDFLASERGQTYKVEAAALGAYGALRSADAFAVLKSGLQRDSHRDVIRAAAIEAIGALDDPEAFDLVLEWTTPGRSSESRRAAVGAAADYASRRPRDDEVTSRALAAITACLEEQPWRLRLEAVEALGRFGRRGEAALPALKTVGEHDQRERVRSAAKRAVDRIRQDAPGQDQLAELRKRLDEIDAHDEELQKRLDAIESRDKAHQRRDSHTHDAPAAPDDDDEP